MQPNGPESIYSCNTQKAKKLRNLKLNVRDDQENKLQERD